NVIDSYFQARVQGKYIMYAQVGANLLSAGIKLALVVFRAPIEWFVWMLLGDVIFLAIGYIYLYKRQGNSISQWRFERKMASELLRYAWPLAFSAVFVTLYMKIDQLMLDAYL